MPPGGNGMYFFYIFVTVDFGEYGMFEIRINEERMCSAYGDHDNLSTDYPSASCGIVAYVEAGKLGVFFFLFRNRRIC